MDMSDIREAKTVRDVGLVRDVQLECRIGASKARYPYKNYRVILNIRCNEQHRKWARNILA